MGKKKSAASQATQAQPTQTSQSTAEATATPASETTATTTSRATTTTTSEATTTTAAPTNTSATFSATLGILAGMKEEFKTLEVSFVDYSFIYLLTRLLFKSRVLSQICTI